MKKIILNIVLFTLMGTSVFNVAAQITIQPQIPYTGLVQQNQLWNVLIINHGEAVYSAGLNLSFQEEGTGKRIFSATIVGVNIPKGVSQLSSKDISHVQYDYFTHYNATSGLLPIGKYIACYGLFLAQNAKSFSEVAQNCFPIMVEPISPPVLSFPNNRDTIHTTAPLFSWVAPIPVNMFTSLRYSITVAPVKNGQSAQQAIQENGAVFVQSQLRNPSVTYPSSYKGLELGKTYAWQVVARNDNTYAVSTDVWTFSVAQDSLQIVLDAAAYPHLQLGIGSNYFIAREKIKFAYTNELSDSTLHVKIYALEDITRAAVFEKTININPGINFIDVDISNRRKLVRGNTYILSVLNGRQEHWDLKFKYAPTE